MTAKKAVSKRGKNVNLYLYDDDVARIRGLVSYVAANGLRVSESLVVRTALRVAQENKLFLAAYADAASADQRFKTGELPTSIETPDGDVKRERDGNTN